MQSFEICIICLTICIVLFQIWFYLKIKKIKINKEQQLKEKNQLIQDIKNLSQQKNDKKLLLNNINIEIINSKKTIEEKKEQIKYIDSTIEEKRHQAKNIYQEEVKKTKAEIEQYKNAVNQAANTYIDNIQKQYEHAEAAHAQKMASLKAEQTAAAASLNAIKETRKAAYEAILKQKQIKEKSIFYTVQLDEKCLHDINLLNSISNQLIDSRPLNMVIWTSYYSKKVNELCSRIIGTEIKSGIYKITFLPTNQCYIGQAKDLKERIRTHIKAGSCHIDTPSNNKLYEKMGKNSIQNFTFQILEYCSVEKLNQKEKYYIDLYQSYDYGFNSNRGISK